ncbi:MAG: hypothetical protein ACXWLR_03940 [Myxococcales bacterium]
MRRARRSLLRLERRPWTLAAIAGLGVTLLVPSALALYGPPELLDAAIAFGDVRLAFGLAGLFLASVALLRLALRRRRLPEEALDEDPAPAAPQSREQGVPAPAARAHLR